VFVFSAITFVKPCTERIFTRVTVDFDSRIVAVIQINLIDEGIDQCRTESVIVRVAVLEFREKVFYLLNGKNRTNHLLFSKLYLKIGFLHLPPLDLCADGIDSHS